MKTSARYLLPRPLAIAMAALATPAATLAADPAQPPTINVIATTPVPGLGQNREEIAAPVRTLDRQSIRDRSSASLTDLLGTQVNGITVNETQGNPFQADVNFRGFTASPLLGTPQGLSIYQDGVRINEPFGDIVNWDLVPKLAIDRIDLIPGSNPLFGLNTLGGALSLQTKSGFTAPGAGVELSAGSFGRRNAEVELGGKVGERAYYVAATLYREDGWRDASPSDVKQAFAKLSHRDAKLDLDLSLTHGDTDLIGNGLLPDSMLAQRRSQVFTQPDNTLNRMTMLALNAAYWLGERDRLSATAYVRRNLTRTLNGDANDGFEGGSNDGACNPADFVGDPVAFANCTAANAALKPDGATNAGFNVETGANNRSRTRQTSTGAALQWAHYGERSETAVGATADRSRSSFEQTHELGIFDAQRGVINGTGNVIDNIVDGRTEHWSLFATHTFRPLAGLAATVSARYNRTRVQTIDRLNPGAPNNLDGDYVYRKLNPAAGLTWALTPAVGFYAGAAQGNRAPSPIELGCADELNPCSLPNAMQADPFLKQVVTRSIETGFRGRLGSTEWNAGLFAANNYDDILFVGTSASQGYFRNFGQTRRQGAELGAAGRLGPVGWRAHYGYVKATYRSSACLLAENNSSRGQSSACTNPAAPPNAVGDDLILVSPGNRIPGIPAHSLKLAVDWKAGDRWTLSAEMQAYSSQYVRGNENNAHQPGTSVDLTGAARSFLGSGKVSGYEVFNLALKGDLGGGWEAFAKISNLFDKRYASGGALGENPFDAAGGFMTNSDDWTRETFTAPGAPRAAWVGVRYRIDAKK